MRSYAIVFVAAAMAGMAGEPPDRGVVADFEAAGEGWVGVALVDGVKGHAGRFGAPGSMIDVGACGVDGGKAFTFEVAVRTTHGEFATAVMARDGESVGLSLVMGRELGKVSFEAWSWQTARLISARRVDDGAWHRVKVVYSPKGHGAVMWIDGKVEAMGTLGSGGSPAARLRLGNNIGTEQGFAGDLDEFSFVQSAGVMELEQVEALVGGKGEIAQELAALRNKLNPQETVIPKTGAAWSARKVEIRAGVLDALGLTPWPKREELEPKVHGALKGGGVKVERLTYSTWPGYRATAWVWTGERAVEPSRETGGKKPAMLMPHGHYAGGAIDPVVQVRAARLARAGYVVLVPDSVHVEDVATGVNAGGAMAWNNIRAIDYLVSREDVDGARIGVTGASGGAQQTMYLMAVEDRLAAAAPVCMVSYFNTYLFEDWAHCGCNHVPRMARVADAPEIAACFSPRPSLFLSTKQDWTATFEEKGWPEIQKLYGLAGAPAATSSKRFDVPHGYDGGMRALAYSFFDPLLRPGNPGATEEGFESFGAEELLGLGPRPAAPDARMMAKEYVGRRRAATLAEVSPGIDWTIVPNWGKDEVDDGREAWRRRSLAGPDGVHFTVTTRGLEKGGEGAITVVVVGDQGAKARLVLTPPGWLSGPAVIVEPRLTGGGLVREAWARNGMLLGCGEGYAQARDIAQAIASIPGEQRVRVVALGESGVSALIAATVSPRVERVVVEKMGPTYETEPGRAPNCPEVRRLGDLWGIVKSMRPRCQVAAIEGGGLTEEDIGRALR